MSQPTAKTTAPGPTPPAAPVLARFSSAPAEVVGHVLDGRYLVERVLGEGAMAVVLGARHMFLDTPVAVKILHPALTAVAEMRERFLREARVTSGVAHEGLVRVSDFGVSAEGLHYLVMERLDGEDLLAWSERRGQASAAECATIALQICDALEALHAAGYVHRDLKPENLWVVGAGAEGANGTATTLRIKVLDLGIAGLIESASEARVGRKEKTGRTGNHAAVVDPRRLTQAGQTLGTALYMSPEQTVGNPLDQRSDLYSLGCVLWELATDRCAFEAPTVMDIMLRQVSDTPPPPSSVNGALPAWFDRIVLKLLAKRPDERFQTAREAAAAFIEASTTAPAPIVVKPTVVAATLPAPVTRVAATLGAREERDVPLAGVRRPSTSLRALVAVAAAAAIALGAWAATRGAPEPALVTAPMAGRAVAPVALGSVAVAPAFMTAALTAPESLNVAAPGVPREPDATRTDPANGPAKKPGARGGKGTTPATAPEGTTGMTGATQDGATTTTDGLWQPAKPPPKPSP